MCASTSALQMRPRPSDAWRLADRENIGDLLNARPKLVSSGESGDERDSESEVLDGVVWYNSWWQA